MFKKITLLLMISTLVILSTGFVDISTKPKTLYRVYLKGESLGLINSKKELEDFIDKKQEEIKKEYKVDKVYVPSELDVVKEITFDGNVKTVDAIYEEIKDKSPFTINGYTIKIKGLDTKAEDGKVIKGKTQKIYTIERGTFTDAIEETVKSFI